MQVMTNHDWFDESIEKIIMSAHHNNREIVLKETTENAFLINKEDVIALAKEFGLIVYEQDSHL